MVAYSARRSYRFTLQINKKYLEYQCDWLSFLGLHGILTLVSVGTILSNLQYTVIILISF